MTVGQSRKGFDIDLREGVAVEGSLKGLLAADGKRVEVKSDYQALKTGRIFLEFEQSGPPTFKPRPSGVAVTVAEWWATVLMDKDCIHGVLLNPTEHVRAIGRVAYRKGYRAKGGDEDLYSGVLVPLGWFLRPHREAGQNDDGTWGELGWHSEVLYREWG
ncbi:MAG: hypothetical protein H0W36_00540 [Gemmatimonadetes bacterium]|nr:hypothetical protein [Gemmatimonadota bacterium]